MSSPTKVEENGETNYEDTKNKKALGGIKTMPFILGLSLSLFSSYYVNKLPPIHLLVEPTLLDRE